MSIKITLVENHINSNYKQYNIIPHLVRGKLTRDELSLPDHIPIGDPGFALPVVQPIADHPNYKILYVPHHTHRQNLRPKRRHLKYDEYVDTLIKSNTITDHSKIWWDIRPHHIFPTLEFRICDCCTKADEAVSIAALIQALVAKMIQLRLKNQTWRKYRGSLINENKWRAIKGGVNSNLIDFGNHKEIPFIDLFEIGRAHV